MRLTGSRAIREHCHTLWGQWLGQWGLALALSHLNLLSSDTAVNCSRPGCVCSSDFGCLGNPTPPWLVPQESNIWKGSPLFSAISSSATTTVSRDQPSPFPLFPPQPPPQIQSHEVTWSEELEEQIQSLVSNIAEYYYLEHKLPPRSTWQRLVLQLVLLGVKTLWDVRPIHLATVWDV